MITDEGKIEALRVARVSVERGRQGICGALPNTPAGSYLREYIRERLRPYLFLEGWVSARIGNQYNCHDYEERMTATRLAWIDWMIDQLEQK